MDFRKAASQLTKRNFCCGYHCVLNSLLERPHPLAKLQERSLDTGKSPMVLTTHLVHSSGGEQVNLENKKDP